MPTTYLDFEKPIAELETKIAELESLSTTGEGPSISDELKKLKDKAAKQLKDTYSSLSPWRKTQVARHPERPHCTDFIEHLFDDFQELAGDRVFGNDEAVIGGLATFRGRSVMIMGHEKGRTTESRLRHNFGMAHPEGYRKAVRLMELADRFKLPVLSFVDTAGAFPGKAGEERGQAEAIARSTERCLTLDVPMVSLIIGEGGSGGAIAIAAANKVLMMEHSIYSVISPEGCASILYRDAAKARDAAEAMKITADDLLKLKVIDAIVKEPVGGAHRDPQRAISQAGRAIEKALGELEGLSPAELKRQRRDRFYAIGREGLN
ncbi:acetyl-CoA carboxylase carboxyltransferase subunit alpha [Henriciella mobilis]|uniref:acetyl-CoA carboxylase carboxyltransferase subunit alpha n=1 Tax=Henriciella mobilis TaxID=2305467 RepID=UPI000E6683CD|nr:acetyl-CoA carboxylase carboxyltransferase subunit alpha [Henriciella mobilis]RIJ17530.1 acetyl-CoA carboxylase carboxyltransferase subunit alpha [Henriciella mobilis]RIJ25483.1 acetyl-CoA carboxylase carboxyltransferase subunit alpha [Henriciella mobilis]